MRKHTTFGPLASIEGHTRDGRRFTLLAADVDAGKDGIVYRCVLHTNSPDLVHDENGKLDLVYPGKTRRLATPATAIRRALEPVYTALHEGRAPGSYWMDEPRVGRSSAKDALIIDVVSYVKETTEIPLHLYRHPIELSEKLKPVLAISKDQELWFRNQGSVRVTERGIEDMTSAIKRTGGRHNPLTQDNIKRALTSSAYAGVAALGEVVAVNYLLDMVPANMQQYVTGYYGAALRVAIGTVGAVLVDSVVPEAYRAAAAGIGVGGVVGGGMMAVKTYQDANPAAPAAPAHVPAGVRRATNFGSFAGQRRVA